MEQTIIPRQDTLTQIREIVEATGPLHPTFEGALQHLLPEPVFKVGADYTVSEIILTDTTLEIAYLSHTPYKPITSCKIRDYTFLFEYSLRSAGFNSIVIWINDHTISIPLIPAQSPAPTEN